MQWVGRRVYPLLYALVYPHVLLFLIFLPRYGRPLQDEVNNGGAGRFGEGLFQIEAKYEEN